MLRLMCVLLLLLSLVSPLTLSQQQTQPYHHQLPFGPPPLAPEFPPDGTFNPAALVPQPEEIAEIGFFPIDALPDGTRPFIARRLHAIHKAEGSLVYLEESAGARNATQRD